MIHEQPLAAASSAPSIPPSRFMPPSYRSWQLRRRSFTVVAWQRDVPHVLHRTFQLLAAALGLAFVVVVIIIVGVAYALQPPGRLALARAKARLGVAARRELPVLLTGETGTGKEGVARAIHAHQAPLLMPLSLLGMFIAFRIDGDFITEYLGVFVFILYPLLAAMLMLSVAENRARYRSRERAVS